MRLADPKELNRIRKDLLTYIFAGDADPLNHKLEWLKPLASRYRAAGVKEVVERYYHDARHEVLNETNRNEVIGNLVSWLKKTIE